MFWREPCEIVVPLGQPGHHWHVAVAFAAVPFREDAGHDKEEDEGESDGE